MEIYAATRPQDGRSWNEDAFLIGRGDVPFAALCDGSGNAQGVAKRALGIFKKLMSEATPENISQFITWSAWAKILDSALLGGPQSTFVSVAVIGNRVVGCCTGDSRLYRVLPHGVIQILTEEAAKHRLGSGCVDPLPIHFPFNPGEVLLLMSDGAWTPLGIPTIQRVLAKSATLHFSDFPSVLLEEAGKKGRADDMTVIALKRN
jgi:serine/threonine protein phosphatase PrpC